VSALCLVGPAYLPSANAQVAVSNPVTFIIHEAQLDTNTQMQKQQLNRRFMATTHAGVR